jgi:hypothetical protein
VTDPNMARDGRTLLDAVITARRWTAEECVRHFADAATTMGEPATLSTAQLKRWRRGLVIGLPRPTACRVAEQVFGYPVEALFAPPPPGWSPTALTTQTSPPSGGCCDVRRASRPHRAGGEARDAASGGPSPHPRPGARSDHVRSP